jgi:3-oxoacyl-[acyl-carrier protein] reductase
MTAKKILSLNHFSQIQIGDQATLVHKISQEDVQAFADLTGDFNPLHMDEEYARKTEFKKPVVHGMLSASFISTIIGTLLPGKGSLWLSQSLEFLGPVYINDEITLIAEVKQKSLSTKLIVLKISVFNQKSLKIIEGESKVKVLETIKEGEAVSTSKNQAVLITGGSGGIGAASARKIAQDGFTPLIHYHKNREEAESLLSEIKEIAPQAKLYQGNLENKAEIDQITQSIILEFGSLYGFIHCAATGSAFKEFQQLEWDNFQKQLDLQLKGAFYCLQNILPSMVDNKEGSIIFIGSSAIDGLPPIKQTEYIVTKASITSLARCLAAEYGPKGIRFNVVSPGMTQTNMIETMPEKAKMLSRMQSPLRRLADPEDIAEGVSFLLSHRAKHITGETLRINGGSMIV